MHELQANYQDYAEKVKFYFYIGDVRNPRSVADAFYYDWQDIMEVTP